jgi:hypothetical protein
MKAQHLTGQESVSQLLVIVAALGYFVDINLIFADHFWLIPV